MGIDYGMGKTNIDTRTGIRYGVISQNTIDFQLWADCSELHYPGPFCPKCGNDAVATDSDGPDRDNYADGLGCADYACDSCQYVFDSSEAYSEEPTGATFENNEYLIESCLDSDLMVLRSPFYTYAPFCSPCVPGAGNLDDATKGPTFGNVKTYALGNDWFENGAPYVLYRVCDDVKVGG